LQKLQGGLDSLADTPEVWVTEVSPVYETEPVDSPAGADPFLNVVVLVDTTLPAHMLLDRALAIESAFGRQRSEIQNAPRSLDVDLIVVGDRRADDDLLTLPHPRAHERAFVLAPWVDVEPDAEIPGVGAIGDLLEKVGRAGVLRRDDVTLEMH
jgi:2-amino-4-hydroxy-6-hydroxymethyldihydropteridine diphosphokinase